MYEVPPSPSSIEDRWWLNEVTESKCWIARTEAVADFEKEREGWGAFVGL